VSDFFEKGILLPNKCAEKMVGAGEEMNIDA